MDNEKEKNINPDLDNQQVCQTCGEINDKDALFCQHCGSRLEENNDNVEFANNEENETLAQLDQQNSDEINYDNEKGEELELDQSNQESKDIELANEEQKPSELDFSNNKQKDQLDLSNDQQNSTELDLADDSKEVSELDLSDDEDDDGLDLAQEDQVSKDIELTNEKQDTQEDELDLSKNGQNQNDNDFTIDEHESDELDLSNDEQDNKLDLAQNKQESEDIELTNEEQEPSELTLNKEETKEEAQEDNLDLSQNNQDSTDNELTKDEQDSDKLDLSGEAQDNELDLSQDDQESKDIELTNEEQEPSELTFENENTQENQVDLSQNDQASENTDLATDNTQNNDVIYCQTCGAANDKDSTFCEKCGFRLDAFVTQPPVQENTNLNITPQQVVQPTKRNKLPMIIIGALLAISLIGYGVYSFTKRNAIDVIDSYKVTFTGVSGDAKATIEPVDYQESDDSIINNLVNNHINAKVTPNTNLKDGDKVKLILEPNEEEFAKHKIVLANNEKEIKVSDISTYVQNPSEIKDLRYYFDKVASTGEERANNYASYTLSNLHVATDKIYYKKSKSGANNTIDLFMIASVSYTGQNTKDDENKISPYYFMLLENVVIDKEGKLNIPSTDFTPLVKPIDNYERVTKQKGWQHYSGPINNEAPASEDDTL